MGATSVPAQLQPDRPRKLSFAQARQERRDYDNSLTMVQRFHAMEALNRELLILAGIDPDEIQKDNTVQRIRRL